MKNRLMKVSFLFELIAVSSLAQVTSHLAWSAVSCDLDANAKSRIISKNFSGHSSDISVSTFVPVAQCSYIKAEEEALEECKKSGYSNCHVVENSGTRKFDSGEVPLWLTWETCEVERVVQGTKEASYTGSEIRETRCYNLNICYNSFLISGNYSQDDYDEFQRLFKTESCKKKDLLGLNQVINGDPDSSRSVSSKESKNTDKTVADPLPGFTGAEQDSANSAYSAN